MRTARLQMGTALAILCLSVPASADPIRITSGALDWNNSPAPPDVSITLAADTFTFGSLASRTGGIFTPWLQCLVPACTGGVTVDLTSSWSGGDLPGTATYLGVTYPQVGGANSPNQLIAEWTGELAIPAEFSGGVLTAPFQFSGVFGFGPTLGQTQRLDLVGSGLASLTFAPYPNSPGAFQLTSVRYEFAESNDVVPEPMTMVLVGTGLAGLASLRRRRDPKEVDV